MMAKQPTPPRPSITLKVISTSKTSDPKRVTRDSKGNLVAKSPTPKGRNDPLYRYGPDRLYKGVTSNKAAQKINSAAKTREMKSIKFHSGNLDPSKGATRSSMQFELKMLKKSLRQMKLDPSTSPVVKFYEKALKTAPNHTKKPSVPKKNVNAKRGAINKMKAQGAKAMGGPTSGYGKSTRPRGK
jgi:hypothetical protein